MASIWGELRRRSVVKIAVAYAIVGWLLIQVADTLLPAFEAPPWVLRVFVLLLAMGFVLAVVLAWIYELTPEGIKTTSSVPPGKSITHATGQRLNFAILALVVLAVGFLIVDQYVLEQSTAVTTSTSAAPAGNSGTGGVQRFTINLGPTQPMTGAGSALSAHVALSRDGTNLAYVIEQPAATQLFLRPLNELQPLLLDTGEYQHWPFFSPDGESIGYSALRSLQSITIRGGGAQTIAEAGRIFSGVWTNDDQIVFCGSGASPRSLFEVSSSGSTATPLPLTEVDQSLYCGPATLPGNEVILFTAISPPGQMGVREPSIAAYSRASGEMQILFQNSFSPHYVEATGHLLYARAGAIWARPFDSVNLVARGPEISVVDGVETNTTDAVASYAVSDTGALVYVRGNEIVGGAGTPRSLVWFDRDGVEQSALNEQSPFLQARVSPSGEQVAVVVNEAGNQDIWIYDLVLNTSIRLTTDDAGDVSPLWTPSGARVVFSSTRDGGGMFSRAADASGQVEQLTASAVPQYPESFSPDGTLLVFRHEPMGPSDLHVLDMTDLSSEPLIATSADEDYSAISPDGRWIAYELDQEVFVRPFPDIEAGGPWQVSRGGGNEPLWNPNGREIFYRQDDGGPVLAVDIDADPDAPAIQAGSPRVLFDVLSWDSEPTYSVSPDGERFLMVSTPEYRERQSQDTELVVVNNWFEELERLAPPDAP